MPDTPRTLDLGCGRRKLEGSVGVDMTTASHADVVCNLARTPWPFRDSSVGGVRALHILEHIENIVGVMKEVHRVCVPGARFHIETPYFTNGDSWTDPTHKHHFTLRSFDYFLDSNPWSFQYTEPLFRLVDKDVSFGSSPGGKIGRWLSRRNAAKFERRWAFIFPGRTLRVTLEVINK